MESSFVPMLNNVKDKNIEFLLKRMNKLNTSNPTESDFQSLNRKKSTFEMIMLVIFMIHYICMKTFTIIDSLTIEFGRFWNWNMLRCRDSVRKSDTSKNWSAYSIYEYGLGLESYDRIFRVSDSRVFIFNFFYLILKISKCKIFKIIIRWLQLKIGST